MALSEEIELFKDWVSFLTVEEFAANVVWQEKCLTTGEVLFEIEESLLETVKVDFRLSLAFKSARSNQFCGVSHQFDNVKLGL